MRLPIPPEAVSPTSAPASGSAAGPGPAGSPRSSGGDVDGGADGSYAALLTDETPVAPPTIFDVDPAPEEPAAFPELSLLEMTAAFWQADTGGARAALGAGAPAAEDADEAAYAALGTWRPDRAHWQSLGEVVATERATETDPERRVDLALAAARLAELAGDERQARAHIEAALEMDVPDSTASAARPGWPAVHRARLLLAERAGTLLAEESPGAESLARLALLPHPDQAAYRELQAEWTLARAAAGLTDASAAAQVTATPAGLPRTLAEAELAWREPSVAAAVLAAGGNVRRGALGAALLALAAARTEIAGDFQAAAEQRYDAIELEEPRRLVRMGSLRDVARLETEAAFAELIGLLPAFPPSPLKVSLARWAARLGARLGRDEDAWALLSDVGALGPTTPALARDRVDLRGRARATAVSAGEAAALLAAALGMDPPPAARAMAARDAYAWASEPEMVMAALDRVDELAASASDGAGDAALALGPAVEAVARRATDGGGRARALQVWQRVDPARWLPAAVERARWAAAVPSTGADPSEPPERVAIWREIVARHPDSPVFLYLASAAGRARRAQEAADLLRAGARAWAHTPLEAPLVELAAEARAAVDAEAACRELEALVASVPAGGADGATRLALGRALRRLGDRARWLAFARTEPAGSEARRAALLLEGTFWPDGPGVSSDDAAVDEALRRVPFHPMAIGIALGARPDPARMARRWLDDEGERGPPAAMRRLQAATWSVFGGDAAGALRQLAPLVAGGEAGTNGTAASAEVGAARRLARRLLWADTDPGARGEVLARLAGEVDAPADRLIEAAEHAGRSGGMALAHELLRRAATAPRADLVAAEIRVGVDPLGRSSSHGVEATSGGEGQGEAEPGGRPSPAAAGATDERLAPLERAAQEGRFAEVVERLLIAPPHTAGKADVAALNLAFEIDVGRGTGARAGEILGRALADQAAAAPSGSAVAGLSSAPAAALLYQAFASGPSASGSSAPRPAASGLATSGAASVRVLEAAAARASALGDARSAAIFLLEAAAHGDVAGDPATVERLLRAAVAADPISSPAQAALRAWLTRATRLDEAADAGVTEAEALVDPGLRVHALVRAAALSVMIPPADPDAAAHELTVARARAIALLRRALGISPADGDVFVKLRDLYELTGDHAALAELLAHRLAHTTNPFEMTALQVGRADLFAGPLGDRAAAKVALGAVLAKEPHHARALTRLADLEEEEGNYGQAADLLVQRTAGERSPEKLRELFLRLGRIHTQRAPDAKRAVTAYSRVLQLDANNREALDALSDLYVGLGETRSATAITERLVRLETSAERRGAYQIRLGQLAERAGDARATVQHYRKAVEEAPRDLRALGELIRFLEKTHDLAGRRHVLDTAAVELRAALLARPTDATVRAGFAAVQRWRGRPASAAAAIDLGVLLGGAPADDTTVPDAPPGAAAPAAVRRLAALGNPEVDDRTYPPAVPSSVRHLFRLLGPSERASQRADPARFGADRSHRIPEGRAPRDLFDGIAADLGVGAYDLYTPPPSASSAAPARSGVVLAALPARPPVLVISRAILEMGPGAIRFAGARVLRLAASHLDVALAGTESDLAAWLLGVVRQFVPTYRRDDVTPDAATAATARMARLIPRKLRADLLPFALESSGAIDAGALALGIRDGANRVGLLAQGHLDVGLRVVLGLAGRTPSAESLREHAEARALVEFALSDEHDELVRALA